MSEDPGEADVVLDEGYTSIDQLNHHLPEGIHYDEDNQQLVVHGEEYNIRNVVSEMKTRAKERGPATYGLTIGGVTLGLLVSGPILGAAAATTGSIVGALYDKGYIEFSEEGLKFNIGDESEYVEPEEAAKLFDPLVVYDDKWYRPDSDTYRIAIELPEGERRYYKTEEGAANRLLDEYGD